MSMTRQFHKWPLKALSTSCPTAIVFLFFPKCSCNCCWLPSCYQLYPFPALPSSSLSPPCPPLPALQTEASFWSCSGHAESSGDPREQKTGTNIVFYMTTPKPPFLPKSRSQETRQASCLILTRDSQLFHWTFLNSLYLPIFSKAWIPLKVLKSSQRRVEW